MVYAQKRKRELLQVWRAAAVRKPGHLVVIANGRGRRRQSQGRARNSRPVSSGWSRFVTGAGGAAELETGVGGGGQQQASARLAPRAAVRV